MNKPAKPEADDLEPLDDGLGPIATEAEMDAWYEHNREAIGQLVEEALAETDPPIPWDPQVVIDEVREELRKQVR